LLIAHKLSKTAADSPDFTNVASSGKTGA